VPLAFVRGYFPKGGPCPDNTFPKGGPSKIKALLRDKKTGVAHTTGQWWAVAPCQRPAASLAAAPRPRPASSSGRRRQREQRRREHRRGQHLLHNGGGSESSGDADATEASIFFITAAAARAAATRTPPRPASPSGRRPQREQWHRGCRQGQHLLLDGGGNESSGDEACILCMTSCPY
jgi:hypothetical protein